MAPLLREGGENPGLIYDEMRDMMQSKVGIIRTKSELEEALEDIKSFKQALFTAHQGPLESTTRDGTRLST